PLADFVDLFVLGEAEAALPPVLAFLKGKVVGSGRDALLLGLAVEVAGCYVPSLYTPVYDRDGIFQSFETTAGVPPRVAKLTAPHRPTAGHSVLLSPDAEFADLYLTELGRGCSRGCRFCAAGFVYRPPRLWSADAIVQALAERPKDVRRIGLLGMEMARVDDLSVLAGYLLDEACSLSFSSLRADVITSRLVELLGKSGLKSAAIAPDGGSERLRRVINKGITEPELLTAAEALAEAGVTNLKLYYMIGLPTETDADIDEMADLTLRIRERVMAVGRRKGYLGTLTLSVNCFVPKPWTPFQFYGMAPVAVLKNRLQYLRKKMSREANVRIIADHPDRALFQATLARGDRRLGPALLAFAAEGGNWRQLLKRLGLRAEDFALRERGKDESFPWEIVDHGIDRKYLWHEYQQALAARSTQPCDTSRCRRCGVCDGN
ncbi:MAG: radical SAM protein, partial [Desulfobulbaceae bacterium]|nr:radical SAM protein [Desulfobulbaceae bacterium]